jgi:hypothetical protein
MRQILLLITIFFNLNLFSQDNYRSGYVITLEGDTIRGLILYTENLSRYSTCSFKTPSRESFEYTPEQVMGYGILNDRTYLTRRIPLDSIPKTSFVEVLAQGQLSLLKHGNSSYYLEDNTQIFSLKNTSQEIHVDGKRFIKNNFEYKGVLSWKMSECALARNMINKINFTEKSLTRIVEIYNACFLRDTLPTKNLKPWSIFSIGPIGAVSFSTIYNLEDIYLNNLVDHKTFSKDVSLSPGITMKFSSPRISERFYTQLDIYYYVSSYQSIKIASNTTLVTSTKPSYIHFPFSFGSQHKLHKLKSLLLIELGISSNFLLTSESYLRRERSQGTIITIEQEKDFIASRKLLISPHFGFGLNKSIIPKIDGLLKLRCQYGASSIENAVTATQQLTIFIAAGVTYSIKK